MTSQAKSASFVRQRRRSLLASFLATTLITSAATVFLGCAGYRLNLTPSEPLGLWRIVVMDRPVRSGDTVFVCAPNSAAMREARSRGYLRTGLCDGGTAPLIKTVAALDGEVITVADDVKIDGRSLAHSRLLAADGQHRSLRAYAGGELAAGEVYLHSDFPGSFDSRYFGPLPVGNVLGLAQEVLTYVP